jgi:predicted  nucleic acid-binding Zn-ribbon protein
VRILKPCRHCGTRPVLYHDTETNEYCVEFHDLECWHDEYNNELYRYDTAREAISEWNRLRMS